MAAPIDGLWRHETRGLEVMLKVKKEILEVNNLPKAAKGGRVEYGEVMN